MAAVDVLVVTTQVHDPQLVAGVDELAAKRIGGGSRLYMRVVGGGCLQQWLYRCCYLLSLKQIIVDARYDVERSVSNNCLPVHRHAAVF